MNRFDVMFWICLVGTAVNLGLAIVCDFTPQLRPNVNIFLFSAFLMSIGMVANYMNCLQAENTKKK